jgi:hypothetical protein
MAALMTFACFNEQLFVQAAADTFGSNMLRRIAESSPLTSPRCPLGLPSAPDSVVDIAPLHYVWPQREKERRDARCQQDAFTYQKHQADERMTVRIIQPQCCAQIRAPHPQQEHRYQNLP